MKNIIQRLLIPLAVLVLVMPVFGLILPADRTYPWQGNVGVKGGIPDSSTMMVYATLSAGASLATINSTVAACPSNQVVQLGSGTFNLGNDLLMKSGVVLRGNGMSNTILVFSGGGGIASGSSGIYNAYHNNQLNGGSQANWTAGFGANTTNLTFDSTTALPPGTIVFLDQEDDPAFVNPNGYEGNPGGPRSSTRNVIQFVEVQSVSGSTVTVWPPVLPIFRTGLSAHALWPSLDTWGGARIGIENLTVDGTASSGTGDRSATFDFDGCRDVWVKNCKSIRAGHSHIAFRYGYFRVTVQNCYIFDDQSYQSQSYGIDAIIGSGGLFENNVFDKVVMGMVPHQNTSVNVWGYNYTTNAYYTASANYLMPGIAPHGISTCFDLFEGNHVQKANFDFTHGSHSHEVLFRNVIPGWEAYSSPDGAETTHGMTVINMELTNRYFAIVGNILGTAGKYNNYEGVPGNVPSGKLIYELGLKNTGYAIASSWNEDSQVSGTLFRHMNYDTVTNSIRYNLTNADVTLPNSLYLSAKPSWWGSIAWPPYNPSNTTAAALSPTNIPAGYWRWFGSYPAAGSSTNPPSITSQPTGVTNSTEGGFNLTVIASGDGTLVYQWRTNNSNVAGATSSTYGSTPAVTNQSSTSYSCVITNAYGSITSSVVSVLITNVTATAPTITTQPVGTTNSIYGGFNLTVAASGTPTIYFQWLSNSAVISGATGSSFGSVPAATAQSASYSVIASNSVGSVTSSVAMVSMTNATVNSLVLALGFNEGTGTNTSDSSGFGNNGTLTGSATWTDGKYGSSVYFQTNITPTLVNIPYATSIDQFTNGITVEAWVYPMINQASWATLFFRLDGVGNGFALNGRSTTAGQPMWYILGAEQYAPTAFVVSNWVHVAATCDGTNRIIYTNGVLAATSPGVGMVTFSGTYPLTIGGNSLYPLETWGGLMDEVRIYNRALSAGEIQTDMATPIVSLSTGVPTGVSGLRVLSAGGFP